ncbi:hypothetical protein FB45DRAFT_1062544 [Roridomyces roridus]|uniref:F-box domain-containing protein n=1 Tax=Roridomyces roridus TaxID=1738132 RepID=A0AAD7FF25_9AGAR|nr:hypothetical protein FB45DRAFT_1062544 [Roridomyces roridus]
MENLPTELIETILEFVDDTESLKSCSLTGSLLRGPSQRILLQTVAIGGDSDSKNHFLNMLSFFETSPQVLRAIRVVSFITPSPGLDIDPLQSEYLGILIAGFPNLRHLAISGAGRQDGDVGWDTLAPGIRTSLEDTISHGIQEALHISTMVRIPIKILVKALSCTKSVSFIEISVHNPDAPETQIHSEVPQLENLVLSNSAGVADVLRRPDVRPFISNVRRLWIGLELELAHVVDYTAPKLDEVFFVSTDPVDESHLGHALPFPQFPNLRFAGMRLFLGDYERLWIVDAMRAILASPIIESILIDVSGVDLETLLPTLDSLADILGSPNIPLVRWLLYVDHEEDGGLGLLKEFGAAVERVLPKAHKAKRVIVDRAESHNDGLFWPSGKVIMAMRLPEGE